MRFSFKTAVDAMRFYQFNTHRYLMRCVQGDKHFPFVILVTGLIGR